MRSLRSLYPFKFLIEVAAFSIVSRLGWFVGISTFGRNVVEYPVDWISRQAALGSRDWTGDWVGLTRGVFGSAGEVAVRSITMGLFSMPRHSDGAGFFCDPVTGRRGSRLRVRCLVGFGGVSPERSTHRGSSGSNFDIVRIARLKVVADCASRRADFLGREVYLRTSTYYSYV